MIADFLRRLAKARVWARSHPNEYAAVLAKETGIPVKVALFSIQSYLGAAVSIDDGIVADSARSSNAIAAPGSFPPSRT